MIRNLLATTAIATLVATGAVAQTTTTPTEEPAVQPEVQMEVKAEGFLAENLLGESVYNGTGDEAENIGSVNDLVISPEGQVEALVIGVGGFLGIGQKDVAIEYGLVEWAEQDGERWLVVETTAEQLEAQQEFDSAAYQPMPADAEVAETKPATAEDLANAPVEGEEAPAGEEMAATDEAPPADDMAAAEGEEAAPASEEMAAEEEAAPADEEMAATDEAQPAEEEQAGEMAADEEAAADETETAAIDRSQLQEAPGDIRAEDFVGTTVYGVDDENIGEIGDVVLTSEGQVDAVIVDVGGFLGIGEKEVALGMENLQFLTDESGELYLYTEFTQEQLEEQPAYDEASFADNRDEMLLNAPEAN